MPREYLSYIAGSNPFATDVGPSAFNPNPPDEMINRQGEPCIWLRALPKPEKLDPARMPSLGTNPIMYRIDRVRRMPQETVINQVIEGLNFYLKYGPISKVHSLYMFRNEDYGGNVNLDIDRIEENRITIKPNAEFVPDYEFQCDYEVETFERRLYKPFIQERSGKFLTLNSSEIIVKILAVYRKDLQSGQFAKLEGCVSDFTKIILPQVAEAGREYILDLITFSPINIGYKTIDLKDKRLSEKSGLDLVAGDLDLVVPTNINLSKDDILIPLKSLNTEKEWIRRDDHGRFPLKYSPVKEIYGIYSDTTEYRHYSIEDSRFLKIQEPTPDDLMVVYGYNPRFIVLPESTISAIARKSQPRKYNARLHQTSLDLGKILESESIRALDSKIYFTGATAYQIARYHGFIGTELEFMTFLKGPKGDSGDKSTQIGPEFNYDVLGNLSSIVYDSGSTKVFTYNVSGQLTRIDFTENGTTTRKTFNYSPDGTLLSIYEAEI